MTRNIEWPTIAALTRFSLTHEAAAGIVSAVNEPGEKTVSSGILHHALITSRATWRLIRIYQRLLRSAAPNAVLCRIGRDMLVGLLLISQTRDS